jgi:hypothetical protein
MTLVKNTILPSLTKIKNLNFKKINPKSKKIVSVSFSNVLSAMKVVR